MTGKTGTQNQNATPQPAISLSQPGILQRTCECGAAPGLTGECEACASKQLSGQRGSHSVRTNSRWINCSTAAS